MTLDAQQVATFYEQGYLVLDNVLTDADLTPLIQEIQSAGSEFGTRQR